MTLRSIRLRLVRPTLAVALLLPCGRALAETDGDWSFSYSDSTGTATITGYSGPAVSVTIPQTVSRTVEYQEQDDDGDWHTRHRTYHYAVTAISSYAFQQSAITGVILPSYVTSIGDAAFYCCKNLVSATVHSSITALPNSLFSGCSALESISFPASVTTIRGRAFQNCTALSSAPLSGITTIGEYAFQSCDAIREVTIPETVTSVGQGAFGGCSGLERVVLECSTDAGWNHKLQDAFYNFPLADCDHLQEIVFGDRFDWIPNEFLKNCSSLRSVQLPSTLRSIGSASFRGCWQASFTDLGQCTNLTTIGNEAFWDCYSIVDLTIPESVESIGSNAFSGCSGLTNVVVNAQDCSAGSVFRGCIRLQKIVFGDSITQLAETFGAVDGCTNLQEIVFGEGITKIPSSFLNGQTTSHTALRKVQWGSKLTEIGHYAFLRCSNAEFPNLDEFKSLTIIGKECFSGCNAVREVTIPATVTSVGPGAFSGCRGLERIALECSPDAGWNHKLQDAFYNFPLRGCDNLKEIVFGNQFNWIPDGFLKDCHSLRRIYFPLTMKSIGTESFGYCWQVCDLMIPKNVEAIGSSAFVGCSGLTNVLFKGAPPTVGSYAFSGVANGARGHYPRSLASQWLPQIDSNGKWNGLIMHELSQPVLRVKSANPAAGTITLAWDDAGDIPGATTYAVYRSAAEEWTETDRVATVTGTEWTDNDYWRAEPVLSPLNYWVVAENDHFDIPESNAVETRHRYGLCVGFDDYETRSDGSKPKPLSQSLADANLFRNLALARAKAERVEPLMNRDATIAGIHDAFVRWSAIVRPGDVFLFYIATHGGYNGKTAGLAAYDGTYLVPQLVSDSSLISSEALFAGVIMACHSRALVDSTDDDPENFAFQVRNGLAQCRPSSAWISSCGFDESSYNTPTSSQTLFGEWFLEEGWQNGYADMELHGVEYGGGNEDGSLSMLELARYTHAFDKGASDKKPSTVFWNEESEPVMSWLVLDAACSPDILSAPAAPTGLTAERHSLKNIALSWQSAQGAKLYRVHRSDADDDNGWSCIRYLCPSPNFIDNTGLALSQLYFYRVQAVNPVGVSEMSSPAVGSAGALDYLGFLAAGAPDIVSSTEPTSAQFEAAAASIGSNGVSLEYSFIAGLDPTDPDARFEARIDMVDGEPVVTPFPDLGTNRVYTVVGKSSLSDPDEDWHEPDEDSRFFRVKVELPE